MSVGAVTTLSGSGIGSFADETGTAASFYKPWGIFVDTTGLIYVGDTSNNRIRTISTSGK